MYKKLLTALVVSISVSSFSTAALAKKGSACTAVSGQMSNIYEVKFLCPELGQTRLIISEIYAKGWTVTSLAFQGNIAAIIIEQ